MRTSLIKLPFSIIPLFLLVVGCNLTDTKLFAIETPTEITATETSFPLPTPTLNADDHVSKASDFFAQELFFEAIEELSIAIGLQENFGSAYALRGTIYGALREFDKGIEDLDVAISLNSENAENYIIRGRLYFDKGFFEDDPISSSSALEDLSKAIDISPESTEAYYLRGQINHELGVYRLDLLLTNFLEDAIEDFTKVIQLDPNNADAYYSRAIDYGLLGDESMIADLEQAIELGLSPEREKIAIETLEFILGAE